MRKKEEREGKNERKKEGRKEDREKIDVNDPHNNKPPCGPHSTKATQSSGEGSGLGGAPRTTQQDPDPVTNRHYCVIRDFHRMVGQLGHAG